MANQYVILARSERPGDGLPELGTREEIVRELANSNVAPEVPEGDVLYGPGIRLEFPPGIDPVNQILLSIMEDEIAWLVILRLAKKFGWRILDTATGREFSP